MSKSLNLILRTHIKRQARCMFAIPAMRRYKQGETWVHGQPSLLRLFQVKVRDRDSQKGGVGEKQCLRNDSCGWLIV